MEFLTTLHTLNQKIHFKLSGKLVFRPSLLCFCLHILAFYKGYDFFFLFFKINIKISFIAAICRHILITNEKKVQNSGFLMVSVNLFASTWNLRYWLFWKGSKIEVKIIAFCQYLLSVSPFSFKNFLKRSLEHDKNMICYSVFLYLTSKTQNLTFSGVAMFWNVPKFSTFSLTFFRFVFHIKTWYCKKNTWRTGLCCIIHAVLTAF